MRCLLLLTAVFSLLWSSTLFAAPIAKPVEWKIGGDTFAGVLVYDDAVKRPRPGLVMVPNWKGVNDSAIEKAHLVAGGTGAHPVVAVALSGLRNGVHFLDKLVGGFSVLLLFGFLYSARVLPRAIAVAGMAGALAQMFAVGRALFGFEVAYGLLVPLSLAFLVTMGWLLARGFTVREDAPA